MKIFSTFSGIGGFEIGIHAAYIKHALISKKSEQKERPQRRERAINQWKLLLHSGDGSAPLCVGYSEIDKYAIKVYERNFPDARNFGDITKINAEELPDFDCLVGGFPCQAFSIAGKRKGFEDTRGTLFFDLARILRAKQPRLFVFENVKGLLSHDGGRTFKTIIQTIDELGYDCQWQVLNSKNHGVPQNRERVYIVGHLRGTPRPEVFPIRGADSEDIKVVGSIPESVWPGRHEQIRRIHSVDGISPTIPTAQGGGVLPKIINPKMNNYTPQDVSVAITASAYKEPPVVLPQIRRLTPKECERLQGFPDNCTAQGIDGAISDTQRYKMCGNAVTTNVVQAVFERIFESTMEANQ